MIGVNVVIILIVAPEFYDFFAYQLTLMGYVEVTLLDVLLYMAAIIGSYNIIQTVFAIAVAYTIYRTSAKYYGREAAKPST
jgi:hypothetical protein